MLHLAVILQPSEASRNDSTVHKMMVQYFFPPAGDIKVEDAWKTVKKSDLTDSILQCILEWDGIDKPLFEIGSPGMNSPRRPSTPKQINVNGFPELSTNPTEFNGDQNPKTNNSSKKSNKRDGIMQFTTSPCALSQPMKAESSMGLLTQLQSSMDELHLKIASLIERFNEESVEEITALKARVELVETKLVEIESASPVKPLQRNGSKLAQVTPERIQGKESNKIPKSYPMVIEKLQRKEEESAKKIALLTEKLEIQKAQQEAQQQAFRNTTAQQMTEMLQRIDQITIQMTTTQRLFNAVKPQWLIGHNEISLSQQEIGSGSWGKVVKATYKGEQVAAKCLHHQIVADYNIQQFVREIDIFAKCQHQNLLKFVGATLEGDPIILTELMHTDLSTVIKQHKLHDYQIIPLLQDIANGINYLHSFSLGTIIHRDISSTNVLLEGPVKSRWVAKLSDFWSANFLWHTSKGSVVPGNSNYAAPEARSPNNHSEKMDVYSFGVLLFEICSGQTPPSSQLRNELLPTAAAVWPKPQCHFVSLIVSCIKENKDERPTMSEVLTQL